MRRRRSRQAPAGGETIGSSDTPIDGVPANDRVSGPQSGRPSGEREGDAHQKSRRSSSRRSKRTRGRRTRDRAVEPLPPLVRVAGTEINAGAVHRSVLAGLVSSVGMRTDEGEYVGPKGVRFRVFPGSALFRQTASWIVAAELVETTRLYARTVARIRADWIERVAPHLVQREVFEPHWLKDAGQVAAWEKVTYQGLTLVARRRVPYGPIDPVGARDIFIQSALVEGDIRTRGEFLEANRLLVARLEEDEAKRRQRHAMVDLQARFAFYDARIPADIHSTPSFERWRENVERRHPRLLHMRATDLLRPGADRVEVRLFPEHLEVAGMRLPLSYRHEPGDPADGVTVTVPLAALNQLDPDRLEWLVPGMLREKILAMLRSLPKRLRVRFVPAPEFAEGAVETLAFGEGSLSRALAGYLSRVGGTTVSPTDFNPGALGEHLHLRLHVVDDEGRTVAEGRDLEALRAQLGRRASSALESVPMEAVASGPDQAAPAPRTGIVQWDFGPLPGRVMTRRAGLDVPAFPALVDEGETVALRWVESGARAEACTRLGVRRLLVLTLADEVRALLDYVPGPDGVAGLDAMALTGASGMTRHELESIVIDRIVERACLDGSGAIRTPEAFQAAMDRGRGALWPSAEEVFNLVGRIVKLRHELLFQLEGSHPSARAASIADLRAQLDRLSSTRTLTDAPWEWLVHVPRYLRAALVRLRKLGTSPPQRDARLMADLEHFAARLRAADPEGNLAGAHAREWWLLEEFRVSLFAQELGTTVPVSPKRLEAHWRAAGVG